MKKKMILFALIVVSCQSNIQKRKVCLNYYLSKDILLGSTTSEVADKLKETKITYDDIHSEIENEVYLRFKEHTHLYNDSVEIENILMFKNDYLINITGVFQSDDSILLQRIQKTIINDCGLNQSGKTKFGKTYNNIKSDLRMSLYPLKKEIKKHSIEFVIASIESE